MLIEPSIDHLLEKVESKYALVVLAARRGRQIREQQKENQVEVKGSAKEDTVTIKEVSQALREIYEDKITYTLDPEVEEGPEEDLVDAESDQEDGFKLLSKELTPEGMA